MATKAAGNMIVVRLSQVKDEKVKWNLKYEDRVMIKSLFPIFFIDTRNLDVTEWQDVWDVFSELIKTSNTERKSIESDIANILSDSDKGISKKFKKIEDLFSVAEVSVNKHMPKDFFRTLAKLYFSGDKIEYKGKKLDYFSTGTNSVKYIELLLRAIKEISQAKLKEPTVLIDEPEISLHPRFVDDFSSIIIEMIPQLCIIVSTHSARFVKNVIKDSEVIKLYCVKLINNYTFIQKMKPFIQYSPESQYRVLDDHVNSYFARAILFVEGETELELFSNPFIKVIFPQLSFVDIYKAFDDKLIFNIMNPNSLHTQTPYICLIDADKVFGFDSNNNRFDIKNEFFPLDIKEKFQFRNKHQLEPPIRNLRKRINAMEQQLKVHYYKPYFSCQDSSYQEFITTIKEYLMHYNVFMLETTIEGVLINRQSYMFALNYLRNLKPDDVFADFERYLDQLPGKTDRINALRIVFNGKSDLGIKYKKIKPTLSNANQLIMDRASIGGKTSGWVSKYINSFLIASADISSTPTLSAFKKKVAVPANYEDVLRNFRNHFPELVMLLDKICGMIDI